MSVLQSLTHTIFSRINLHAKKVTCIQDRLLLKRALRSHFVPQLRSTLIEKALLHQEDHMMVKSELNINFIPTNIISYYAFFALLVQGGKHIHVGIHFHAIILITQQIFLQLATMNSANSLNTSELITRGIISQPGSQTKLRSVVLVKI